ncbi:MAG: HAD family phosphatase [Oscillospiraceae bacterium]|jgi:HAD superfamily hydrolase (TIGR01509 family)|nr:HAD family phosphatase [Oscillospiraceae bacterium]
MRLQDCFPPHRAAIFDLDGTLLDSMWVWHRVDAEFFARRRLTLPADYAAGIVSMTFRETAEYTIARFGLREAPETVMAEWNELSFAHYRDDVRLKPGAYAVLRQLRAMGVKLGIATSLTHSFMEAVLASNGILDWFDALASCDDVRRGKGYPDIYRLAAARLGETCARCVAFEDIAKGLQGVRAAGMTACAVWEPASGQDWDEMCRLAAYTIRQWDEVILNDAKNGAAPE